MFFALPTVQRVSGDKFERFVKDLLDTCLKFLLHSVPDPPGERKASVTHEVDVFITKVKEIQVS